MTIENPELWAKSAPDWAMLDGCWTGRIKPSDVDGFVEYRGRTLFLEHKSTPTAEVKDGQHYAYQSWARQGNTVFVFWSDGGEKNVRRIRIYHKDKVTERTVDLAGLRSSCRRWFMYAQNAKKAA